MSKDYRVSNMYDSYRGVIHMMDPRGDGESTLCGYTWDEPSSEHDAECMVKIDKPCNCPDCLEEAKAMLPHLKRELRRAGVRISDSRKLKLVQ